MFISKNSNMLGIAEHSLLTLLLSFTAMDFISGTGGKLILLTNYFHRILARVNKQT